MTNESGHIAPPGAGQIVGQIGADRCPLLLTSEELAGRRASSSDVAWCRSVERAEFVGVRDRDPPQYAVLDGVLAHPPQRRAVGVDGDAALVQAGQPVDVV